MRRYDAISKFKLNRLFKKGDFKEIVKIVKYYPWHLPYPLSEFKKEHIDALTDYAIEKDYNLMWKILDDAPQADGQRIVRNLLDKYYGSVLSYTSDKNLMNHFELFLDELIIRKDINLMLKLAEIATRMPKKMEYMARIISYAEDCQKQPNLSQEVSNAEAEKEQPNLSLELSKIPGYNDVSLRNKINTIELKEIIDYISYCRDEDNLKTAIDDYFKKANIDEVAELLVEFKDRKAIFNRIYDYIMEMEDREQASDYLLEVLKLKPDYHSEDITTEIIHHGSIETLSKLMTMLSEKEQNELIQSALDSGDYDLIYDFAVTTDCTGTYKLIDTLLGLNRMDVELCLLLNLKRRFLGYAWKYMFDNRSIDYIRDILNTLYTTGEVGYIDAIKFIVEYKYADLFNEQEQANIMEAYEQKEDLALTLKK